MTMVKNIIILYIVRARGSSSTHPTPPTPFLTTRPMHYAYKLLYILYIGTYNNIKGVELRVVPIYTYKITRQKIARSTILIIYT